jgi:hypothetical protein
MFVDCWRNDAVFAVTEIATDVIRRYRLGSPQ